MEEQTLFVNIVNIASEAIISVDEAQEIILFNQGAEKIFGYTSNEIIGEPLDKLLPVRAALQHRDHIAEFADADVDTRLMGERGEIFGRRKNGEEFPAEASISKFDLNGKQKFTVVLRDITERKQNEKEREELINGLKVLDEATQAITSELSTDQVLQKIAQAAKSLIKVKFAALGVHDGRGKLSRFVTAGISAEAHAEIGAFPVGKGLLGLILYEGQSVIVNDMVNHPAAVGFPEYHPPMRQFLGVPIHSKDKLIGAFYLADKEDDGAFTKIDQQLVEMLARHALIAIENARLYEKMQRLAVLEERERFARDLHDGIIQSIYGVGLSLDNIKVMLPAEDEDVNKMLTMSIKNLAQVITDVRNYIFDLRPQALKGKDLQTRLQGLVKEMQVNTSLGIESDIEIEASQQLDSQQASHFFHIAHEALANVARHAKARKINMTLKQSEAGIQLRIEDDGVGFEPRGDFEPGHHGLANIYARAEQLEADLQIDSAPQRGTRLKLTLANKHA